jgi:PAT family acetyl-CoA transporter-like MFS transporter 1
MAFYARISDPSIGGTYMTFLNTITNLGSKWPNSVALALVDHLTIRECLHHQVNVLSIGSHTCSNAEEKKACQEAGGQCLILQDGFFIQTAICTIIGLVWLVFFYSRLNILQNLKIQAWRVNNNTK